MVFSRRCLLIASMVGLGLIPSQALGDTGGPASNRVIVVFAPGTSASQRAAARAEAKSTAVKALGRSRFELVAPAPGRTVDERLRTCAARSG